MVYHILKDGTVTKDITGRIVKIEDAEPLYNLMTSINRKAVKSKPTKKSKAS